MATCAEAGVGDSVALISELFHALNQPLTSLQCSLELSLQRPRSEEEYRLILQRALQQAEEVARLSCGIRDLLQAGDPGDKRQRLSFGHFLQEAVDDLQPVAESLQVQLLLQSNVAGFVFVEQQRLRQALFSLIEFVIDRSRAGAVATLQASEEESEAVLWLTTAAKRETNPGTTHPLSCAIARRIIEAAGGILQFSDNRLSDDRFSKDHGTLNVELRLPLIEVAV